MDDDFAFYKLSDCDRVDRILQEGLVVESDNLDSVFLWRAKWHAGTCDRCQDRHPNVLESLARMITEAEAVLGLEVDKIRGEHLCEASEIARRSILSCPPVSSSLAEESGGGEDTPLALIRNLAEAGKRIKQVFAAVHGEGLVWFNVVPDLGDSEQELARKECAGLVKQLSPESREFAFSAALAAELFPELLGPDSEPPMGVDLGVLYKVVQAAASGYVGVYLKGTDDPTLKPPNLSMQHQLDTTGLPPRLTHQAESDTEKVESIYEAQTAIMDVQSDLMVRMRLLEEWRKAQDVSRNTPDDVDAECDAVLRNIIGTRFEELAKDTRRFLLTAERHYAHPQAESDFTTVVLYLTKAFESEFRQRVLVPLVSELEPLAITDSTFKGDLPQFTIGQCHALFNKYKLKTEPLFERLGLQRDAVCTAIFRVNKEKGVKHTDTKNKTEATEFRAAFVGEESVLMSLFPRH